MLMFDESFKQSTKYKQLDVHVCFWEAGCKSHYLGSQFMGHSRTEDLLHHFKVSIVGIFVHGIVFG